MTTAHEGGFWNRKAVQELLLRPLRERGIKTRDDKPAWQQLRDQVLRHRKNRAQYTPKAQRIADACAQVMWPGAMLLDAVEFEGPLPKYLMPFATALHHFHVAMRKRHGVAYRKMTAAVFDAPKMRAFFDVYTRLNRAQPTFLLKDLGVIQARGIACPTASGDEARIRINDYGIEGLVALTTELEEQLTKAMAKKRMRKGAKDRAIEEGDPKHVLLELVEADIVDVYFLRKKHRLRNKPAALLRTLYWAHHTQKRYVTYDELEQALQQEKDIPEPRKRTAKSNNKFSALVLELRKKLEKGLGIKISQRAPWIKCYPGRGYGLNITQFVWKTKKDRTGQRAAGVVGSLRAGFETHGKAKRRGRTGEPME